MKWVLVLVVIAVAAWYFLYYKQPEPPETPPVAVATSTPAPARVSTPAPVSTPPPVVRHIAPQGTYYLLQAVSITNDSGIIGISEGTKVTVVKDTGPKWLMTDGQTQFEVGPDQLTNDLDVAAAAIKKARNMEQANTSAVNLLKQQESDKKLQQLEAMRKALDAIQAKAQQDAAAGRPTPTPAGESPGYTPSTTSSTGAPPPFGRPAPP